VFGSRTKPVLARQYEQYLANQRHGTNGDAWFLAQVTMTLGERIAVTDELEISRRIPFARSLITCARNQASPFVRALVSKYCYIVEQTGSGPGTEHELYMPDRSAHRSRRRSPSSTAAASIATSSGVKPARAATVGFT